MTDYRAEYNPDYRGRQRPKGNLMQIETMKMRKENLYALLAMVGATGFSLGGLAVSLIAGTANALSVLLIIWLCWAGYVIIKILTKSVEYDTLEVPDLES